jgi:hypothetical protein
VLKEHDMKPISVVETITPDTARRYLASSTGNRPLRASKIESLSERLRSGKWQIGDQAITFDVNGRLINGHHRLTACIEAGISFQSFVTRGLPPESYFIIDEVIPKTPAERANVPKVIGADAYYAWCGVLAKPRESLTPEVLRHAASHVFFKECEVFAATNIKRIRGASAYRVGAVFAMHTCNLDRVHTLQQYRLFVEGKATEATNEIGCLMNEILQGKVVARGYKLSNRAFVKSIIAFAGDEHYRVNQHTMDRYITSARQFFCAVFGVTSGRQPKLSSPVA